MNIKPLSNNPYFSRDISGKTSDSKEQVNVNPKIKDKLELSDEAKKIQTSAANGKNLEEIKAKVANKFYDSEKVLNTVADKIMKELGSN